MPWDLPEDRAFFRDATMGHAIIMGRRTWDERGEPLPGRRNIVVSRSGAVSGTGREVVSTIEEAIALARATDPDPFVVGGAEIFKLAFPYATRILYTAVDLDVDGDTFYPRFDMTGWHVAISRRGDRATYLAYERAWGRMRRRRRSSRAWCTRAATRSPRPSTPCTPYRPRRPRPRGASSSVVQAGEGVARHHLVEPDEVAAARARDDRRGRRREPRRVESGRRRVAPLLVEGGGARRTLGHRVGASVA